MTSKHLLVVGLAALSLFSVPHVTPTGVAAQSEAAADLVTAVREATEPFTDVVAAEDAGYGLFHGCVSGPQSGAMGIHLANGELVGDGALDAMRPEALLYESRDGQLELLGVEFVVLANDWHAENEAPPVLMGQLFNYVASPNRYGLPDFYELHVWAWRENPNGVFADWNPTVSCAEYSAHDAGHSADE